MIRWMVPVWAMGEQAGLRDLAAQAVDGPQRDPMAVDTNRLILIAVGFVAVVLLTGLLCCFSESQRKHVAFHSPSRLFFALARTHRLGFLDIWLLWRTACAHQLDDPARLFLEPERFDPQALPRRLARRAGRLKWLKSRIFVDLEELARVPQSP